MGPAALTQVLRPLTQHVHPDLLVGLQTSDDAAVYRLSADLAIIQTVDFFPPVVDDPYAYGAISAANSMSDVYAMGGDVLFALNIAAFPDDLSPDILTAIFEGGAAKVAEAGGVIAGGHTITDDEPKYGLTVTGRIHPDHILTKAGAKPGDRLFLTKPLGTGLITTAGTNDAVEAADLNTAIVSMMTLNRAASEVIRASKANACTDVTGFGLLGHAAEIAEKSGVGLRLSANALPLLPGALRYAAEGQQPGGLSRNREYFMESTPGGMRITPDISAELIAVMFGPETSGGLLVAIPGAAASELESAFAGAALPLWSIGDVVEHPGIEVVP
jgi:selenide,water dikinase